MNRAHPRSRPVVEGLQVTALRIPTEVPESDGTLAWDHTSMVLVELQGGGKTGLGYTYASRAAGDLIREMLESLVVGSDLFSIPQTYANLRAAIRNQGNRGIAAMAVSAVDVALWDLAARVLDLPLVDALGRARERVEVYGSGGFTSYTRAQMEGALRGWADLGLTKAKIKVGRRPSDDPQRVAGARDTLGASAELFVDANGAYSRKQALSMAERFRGSGVSWFEEPVSSDDLEGLRLLRDSGPEGLDIAAGEYGYDPGYFRRMLEAGAVDVLQADATRCGGVSGFLRVAALSEAFHVPLSAHCAPALHLQLCLAAPMIRHLEYFHDHVRIEEMLFDGVRRPVEGALRSEVSRPGLGLELKRRDAARFEI